MRSSDCIRLPAVRQEGADAVLRADHLGRDERGCRAIDTVMRKPARMPGSAAGQDDLPDDRAPIGMLKLCAHADEVARHVLSTPARSRSRSGRTRPRRWSTIFGASPMPSHKIKSGSSAIFGIGKIAETSGMPIARPRSRSGPSSDAEDHARRRADHPAAADAEQRDREMAPEIAMTVSCRERVDDRDAARQGQPDRSSRAGSPLAKWR